MQVRTRKVTGPLPVVKGAVRHPPTVEALLGVGAALLLVLLCIAIGYFALLLYGLP